MRAIGLHALPYLGGQFAGRCQDQGAHAVRLKRRTLLQALQNRQGETCGLTGAGLGCRHHVLTRQYRRYGLDLNG